MNFEEEKSKQIMDLYPCILGLVDRLHMLDSIKRTPNGAIKKVRIEGGERRGAGLSPAWLSPW